MLKLYLANLTDAGFLKLNYYIEEEISSEFIGPLDKYTPIDGWVNGILAEIGRHPWQYEDPNIELLCHDIFPLLSKEKDMPASFLKSVDYIKRSNLIQWAEKN